jgi:hypothetical protein
MALPVWADETAGNEVRVSTSRLDLVFSLDEARPVAWRACHPSCAQADRGRGTWVRFTNRIRRTASIGRRYDRGGQLPKGWQPAGPHR